MGKIFNRSEVVNKIDLLFERLNRINEAEIELREDLGDLRVYCYTAQKNNIEAEPSASDNNQMDAIAEQYINEVAFLDSSDTGVVRSFAAYLQQQHH